MARIIDPPKERLDQLSQPLTNGEIIVLNIFDEHLDEGWEIYLHPHLNGLKPDFVLLHPKRGIGVFEVKDWDLESVEFYVETIGDNMPILKGKMGGESFPAERMNPVNQVVGYQNDIFNLYCPRLDGRLGIAAITAGLIFPFADDVNALRLCEELYGKRRRENNVQYLPIAGKQAVLGNEISSIFPMHNFNSNLMDEEKAADIRAWLVEPEYITEQESPIILDKKQLHLIETRTTTGFRRIKGPTGSGKTMVLASRAAEVALEGKKVLVVTYNITLLNYIRDISVRYAMRNRGAILLGQGNLLRKSIKWVNFHYLCKRLCAEAGKLSEYNKMWEDYLDSENSDTGEDYLVADVEHVAGNKGEELEDLLVNMMPAITINALEEKGIDEDSKYDAIFVDEGQDFHPLWWDVLRKIKKKYGEMVLAADTTQDIYGRSISWTEDIMNNTGFRGPWRQMNISYRLPLQVIEHAKSFADMFLPEGLCDIPEPPQLELDLYDCRLKWVQVDQNEAVEECINQLRNIWIAGDKNISVSDLIFLADSNEVGTKVIEHMKGKRIRINHTFHPEYREGKRSKLAFYLGSESMKATTIHSFKGFEGRAIVVLVTHAENIKTLMAFYTAMTRIRRSSKGSFLTVVCSSDRLLDYGKTWPEFETSISTPV